MGNLLSSTNTAINVEYVCNIDKAEDGRVTVTTVFEVLKGVEESNLPHGFEGKEFSGKIFGTCAIKGMSVFLEDAPSRRRRVNTACQDKMTQDEMHQLLSDIKSFLVEDSGYDDAAADDDSEWTKVEGGMNLD
jgi:hypothetical protein